MIPGQVLIPSGQCLGGNCQGTTIVETTTVKLVPENLEIPDEEEEDDDYAQAESSVKGGEVMASAQGTKNGGTAETQVSGTYTGTGSFSATAQTSDKDRSATASVNTMYLLRRF